MKFLHELFLRDRRPSFNMADNPGPGSVRANLADQTEAKSHAFVRVNSIHCPSLSLSLSPSISHSCNDASSLSNSLLYISACICLSLFLLPSPYPLYRSLPLCHSPSPFSFPLPLTCTPPPCFLPHHPRERPFQSMSSRQRSFRQSFLEGRARQRLSSRGGARAEGRGRRARSVPQRGFPRNLEILPPFLLLRFYTGTDTLSTVIPPYRLFSSSSSSLPFMSTDNR